MNEIDFMQPSAKLLSCLRTNKYNSLRLKDKLEENLFPLNQGVSARRSANWNDA